MTASPPEFLPYHAIIGPTTDGGATIIRGETSVLLSKEQFAFFKKYRWFTMAPERLGLLPEAVTEWFRTTGFLVEASPRQERKKTAAEIVSSALMTWRPLMACHVIYPSMSVSRTAATLYLLERALFTYYAPKTLARAASLTWDPVLRPILDVYAKAETGHHVELARSLGLTPNELIGHEPSEGMMAMLMALDALALQRPFSLLVVFALFEAGEDTDDDNFKLDHLEKITGLDLTPFVEHAGVDNAGGHADLWKLALSRSNEGSLLQANDEAGLDQVIRDLHSVKHLIDLWNTSILKTSTHTDRSFKDANLELPTGVRWLLQRQPGSVDFAN